MTAEHLIAIGSGEFSVWRSLCFRRAGLPFDWAARPDITHEPLFLEALTWQNPPVAERLRRLADRPPERRVERTVAGYRTRYCAKNDSIGFFGPLSWGTWTEHATKIGVVEPVDRGPVFFEIWALQAVADALVERHGLRPWAVPTVAPVVALDADGAHLADGSRLTLSPVRQRVLAAVDGFATVSELAAECAGPETTEEVVAEIRVLQAMGLLTKGFHVTQGRRPERQLAAQLARVADTQRREAALGELGTLVSAGEAVADALGDPAPLAAALAALDDTFSRLTERPAHRREAEYYAARTVAFEDCVGDPRPEVGVDVLAELGPALELLLHSARWFTTRVAAGYLTAAAAVLRAEPRQARDGYPLTLLLSRLAPMLAGTVPGPVDDAVADLRRRWTALLDPGTGDTAVHLTAADLAGPVRQAFPAAGPGWPSARWHSPDVMLAASTVDDLRAGRYLAVLGELHPSINAVDQLSFYDAHPDQAALRRWIDTDMPHRWVPLYQMSDRIVTSQTSPPEAYHSPGYTYLGIGTEPSYAPRRARTVAAGGLRVHDEDGRLLVRSAVTDEATPLVEILDDYLGLAAFNRFSLLEPASHRPRVRVDRLVVSRERWSVPLDRFAAPRQARLEQVLALMRDVAATTGLPDHTFWVIPGEPKPMYVDLADAAGVDAVFAKLRRSRERTPEGVVTVTEMLPGPADLWLTDGVGQRYTCEFRLVCVDGQQYRRGE
ncbi:Lantibiotic dehydratase, C terminus [Asanoa hainanensis]|uniref:Lantibiotic dehydratase, C terminus n=1 Tax=Asanoa hainanensis TaxID=560556 RepID=A0A239N0P3_9ACTN|nr:lantibiotic dehydratase [Asanoa hainanensis]SNT48526.1 Lantibiotic dehydratase, C terminus [Asanoa hainanensis]